ncbi:DUF4352 domain-containing protein [Halalkalibacterium halodurans]|uniref:BH3064 protein n=2 Tax=Halalkalibacterium halodurans TaxID=86665 RepID=Q9K8E2_HALH5|nr:DUF4352 domain-containing protein [Halalkalibacterium halodurans]MDY7223610.1 DUF4352 domain-containing protein [Halalkalibacterium halodurans]MDY7242831.1 DUF4352 domain-containing protein [Halalkalibacterium halodurans]MED4125548.1 DUF4352 domain-containing protein [Halalkalibacterium halodurans]MED4162446.1 DUF4352 domain-containing protein [Halalkalibacterium halodurans]MED4172423.1 DUF4352 domain-containing protein [Halalkalibacterium halodurans]
MSNETKPKKPFYKKWWVWLIAVIVIFAAVSGGDDDSSETAQEPEPEAEEVSADQSENESEEPEEAEGTEEDTEEESAEEEDPIAGLGEALKVGDVVFTANGTSTAGSVGDVLTAEAKGTFLIVDVTIKNEGSDSITVDSSFFKLKVGDVEYDSDSSAGLYANEGADFFLTKLNPGLELPGKVVFDVPQDVLDSDDILLNVQTGFFGTQQGEIKIQ